MTELKSQIEELVGPAIQVNDEVIRACQEKNEFGGLSFALYREATGLIWVTSNAGTVVSRMVRDFQAAIDRIQAVQLPRSVLPAVPYEGLSYTDSIDPGIGASIVIRWVAGQISLALFEVRG